MLELDEGQLSRPVLRGGGGGNATSLPDPFICLAASPFICVPVHPPPRVLLVRIAFLDKNPLKLGQRVEVEIVRADGDR
jgi:hypothetical protein